MNITKVGFLDVYLWYFLHVYEAWKG